MKEHFDSTRAAFAVSFGTTEAPSALNARGPRAVPPQVPADSTRCATCAAVFALAVAAPGCAIYEYVGVGPVTSASGTPGHTGGALDMIAGVGRIGGPVQATAGGHLKLAENMSEGGPSLGLDVSPDPLGGRFVPFIGAGVRPFGIGGVGNRTFGGDKFAISLMSPHATAGLMWLVAPSKVSWPFTDHLDLSITVVLRTTAEYTLRVTSQPNELYLSGVLGMGFYFGAH